MSPDPLTVVAAVIEYDHRFLLTRRQDGVHLAGHWEFPGGKVGAGELHAAALQREIVEELDSDVMVHELVFETTHAYPDRTVALFFYRCDLIGVPKPMLGQQMEWIPRSELSSLLFPPADEELVKILMAG
jgi:mutator protein MutT